MLNVDTTIIISLIYKYDREIKTVKFIKNSMHDKNRGKMLKIEGSLH